MPISYICQNFIIIGCKCFFLFIGRESTTRPANNCLQIKVCSCAVSFNCFWLQILFCSCVNETTLAPCSFMWCPSVITSGRQRALTAFRRNYLLKNKLSDRMIKQLLNSVIAKYRDLSVSRRSIICLSLRLLQIIDLLATDKSRYFAQPRPIIANCFQRLNFSVTYRAPNLTATSKNELDLDKGYFERIYGTFLIWLC